MKNRRRLSRNLAFQALFELESQPERPPEEVLRYRAEELEEETGERPDMAFAARLVEGTLAHRAELDQRIARLAPAFPVEQIPVTDRVALELAMFELLHAHDAPVKVIINEAVELAKTYGAENSGRFVNGVLGTIAEELETSSAGPTGSTTG